jgi:3-isopropylmalate/(R)-2-methylmalate dehydratase small subunit
VVGASFAEIFFGNAVMIGLPCVTLPEPGLAQLRAAAGEPAAVVTVDLATMTVSVGGRSITAAMPEASRQALVSGAWDGTGILLQDYDAVRRVAAALPYVTGY